jgi:hypothetical protein
VRYIGQVVLEDTREALEDTPCTLVVTYGEADGVEFEEYELNGHSMSYDDLKAVFGEKTETAIELARENGEAQ